MFCCTGIFLTRMMELKIPQWWTVPWYVLHISRSHVHSLVSLGFKVPSPETSESAKQEVIKSPTCDKMSWVKLYLQSPTCVMFYIVGEKEKTGSFWTWHSSNQKTLCLKLYIIAKKQLFISDQRILCAWYSEFNYLANIQSF